MQTIAIERISKLERLFLIIYNIDKMYYLKHIWASTREFGTYAFSSNERSDLRCSNTLSTDVDEDSGKYLDF